MKRLRVYFNFANYDSITVNWSVKQSDKVIDNGVKIINLPYIDLPFYENAEYNLSYFATNSYGKSPKYEFQTTTTTKTDYITFINVEVAPTKDSARLTWNRVEGASEYTVYIFHGGATSRVTVYNNEYNFKPSQDGNYSFAVEVNGVLSEKTPQYYLSKKPIIGTNQKPNPPSVSANATYDKKTYKATVTITVTHSNSSDVAGTYLTVQPDGQGKEIFYLPASAPSTSETVTKEYIVTADTNIIVTAYSITVDGVISDTVSYSVPISIGSTLPSVPANLTLTTTYDTNLQAPVVDISFDAVTWEVPFSYEVAYSFNGLNWTYLRTNEISVRIIAPYGGITAYAKVRVIDTHDNVSSWSAVKSITVAGDSVAPATPTGLTASGLFQKVLLSWDKNTEPDLDGYEIQIATDPGFTQNVKTFKVDATTYTFAGNSDTTYYFRIRAVDKSENKSGWSSTVSASTAKVYDADLESQTLNNAVNDLNALSDTVDNVENYTRQVTFVLNSGFEDAKGQGSIDGWNTWNGSGTVVQVTDGIGSKYAATNDNGKVWWVYSNKIPIDHNNTYIVECYARTVSGTDGTFYLAVVLFDANGNNISGDGTWWYYPAAGAVPPSTWRRYTGLVGAGTSRPFPSNARYMSVGFILNYFNGNRKMQVQQPRIRLVMDSTYIKDAAITSAKIANAAIEEAHIKDAAVSTAKIQDAAITNAKIGDLAVDNAKIANVDASKITTGYLDADRIQAGSITSGKLVVQPANALPEGTIAYWTDSLIDVVNGIVPEGYTEVNLAPSITLTPYNAPEGSVVGDLLAGNTIYANKRIEVGTDVNRWAIDGSKGFVRVINDQDYKLLGIVYGPGSIDMSGLTEAVVELPTKLQQYFVILGISNFTYWQSNFDPQYSRQLVLDWTPSSDINGHTSFKILAYTKLIPARVNNPVTNVRVPYNSTERYTTIYTINEDADTVAVKIRYISAKAVYTHRYTTSAPYTIKVSYYDNGVVILDNGRTYPVGSMKGHIDWGDGTIVEWQINSARARGVLVDVLYYDPRTVTKPANATITYSVIGY